MKEIILDKNLERILKIKMCVDDIQNIEEIEEISIQNVNLMENKLNIDLTEISKLKGLKKLYLKFFEITDEIIETINNLEFIEQLEFSMCIFKCSKILNQKLKNISIYNCENFNINILNNNLNLTSLEIFHSGLIDINKLGSMSKLTHLKISHCNIVNIPNISQLINLKTLYLNHVEIPYDIDITRITKLEKISLNGSSVLNKEQYIDMLRQQNKNIVVDFEENDLPIE